MIQTPPKTLLAYVLSMTLLWVFAACILSCEKQCGERATKESSDSSAKLQAAPNCEDCPLNSFPKAIAHRLGFNLDLQAQALVPYSIPANQSMAITDLGFVTANFSQLALDPPIKRLPSLRI